VADRSVSVPIKLIDLERRDARGKIFQADLLVHNKFVRPRWPYDMRPSVRAEK